MRVEVKVFASLRRYLPGVSLGEGKEVELPAASSGRDLLALLGIPEGEAAIFLVNGRRADPAVPLQEGDRVSVFPPLGGG